MSVRCRVIEGGLAEITLEYKPNQHYGIDLVNKGYVLGNITAHSDGIVLKARNNCNATYNTNAEAIAVWGDGFGNYVLIDHQNGFYTQYEHLAYNSLRVKVGDRVSRGQILGYMGNTGHSRGGHLHFQIQKSLLWSNVIDPTLYLDADFIVIAKATPVARNNLIDQLKVLVSELRIRTTPSINGNILGMTNKGDIYNFYDKKNADGYIWYKIAENNWIAYQEGWLEKMEGYKELYEKTLSKITDLENEISRLNDTVKSLNGDILIKTNEMAELESEIEDRNDLIDTLNQTIVKINDKVAVLEQKVEECTNSLPGGETSENDTKIVNKIIEFIKNILNKFFK